MYILDEYTDICSVADCTYVNALENTYNGQLLYTGIVRAQSTSISNVPYDNRFLCIATHLFYWRTICIVVWHEDTTCIIKLIPVAPFTNMA